MAKQKQHWVGSEINNRRNRIEMSNEDKLLFEGKVISSNGDFFKVEINEGYIVDAKISGKLRKLGIQILTLDNVRVEVSPFNTLAGRIVYRLK